MNYLIIFFRRDIEETLFETHIKGDATDIMVDVG